jgi:hypothetical protein
VPVRRSLEPEFLVDGRHLVEGSVPLGIGLGLVGQHGVERDAPVGAEAAVGQLAVVEELNQRGA